MKQQRKDTASTSRAVAQKPRLAIVPAGPATSPPVAPGATASLPVDREERIRRAAYDHYVGRGRIDGHALNDWVLAEAEIGCE